MSAALSLDPTPPPAGPESGRVPRRGGPVAGVVPHHRIAILGAGFGGLGMAIRLLQSGERDLVVLERADRVGGAWRDNTYPGLQCDVASNVYSFSFAPNPSWSRAFAWGPEIQAYLEDCTDRFGVRPHVRFGAEVLGAEWREAEQRWHITTSTGELTADVLVSGHGGLSAPSTPALPGLERFQGEVFHSSAWRHDVDLTGKRVAVVGTGASAIQIIPSIQPKVGKLTVFQRTPAWIVPRIDPEWSGVRRWLFRNLPLAQKLDRLRLYAFRELVVLGMAYRPEWMRVVEGYARKHLENQVADPELRRKLTPDYGVGCKRILLSSDYYPAFTRPNVQLVTEAVREVRERSVVAADGSEHEVDVLVFATGFKVADHPIMGKIRGRDGRTLAEHWSGGAAAYLGTTVTGFPNLFVLSGPHTGIGHNSIVYMLESQFEYVLGAVAALRERGAAYAGVRAEVQADFVDEMQQRLGGTVWNSGCRSWYLDERGRNSIVWPTFTFSYRARTRRFDAEAYRFEAPSAAALAARQARGTG